MKARFFLLLLFLSLGTGAFSQNLVSNGSFEIYEDCPIKSLSKKKFVTSWFRPTWGTPDYFNVCSRDKADVPDNFAGNEYPEDGNGYAGFQAFRFYYYKNKSIREYISTQLKESLIKDSLYCLSFHISWADDSYIQIDQLGAYFSFFKPRKWSRKKLNKTPQVKYKGLLKCPKKGWIQLHQVYKAKGNERFLTIGNFQNNTNIKRNNTSNAEIIKKMRYSDFSPIQAYFYIDKVELRPLSDPKCPCRQRGGAYTLSPE